MPKPLIREITIRTLAEYVEFVERECGESWVLFRGQVEDTAAPKNLLPKIARSRVADPTIVAKEKKLFADFKNTAIPYIERNFPDNDWEWLTPAAQPER